MQVGHVGKLCIKINNYFLLLLFLFFCLGMAGKVLLVFTAVLWHELAHVLTALALNYHVREVELLPFGSVARIETLEEESAIGEFLIALAGPLASLTLAAIFYWFSLTSYSLSDILNFYCHTNLMLALFNLLPGLPLDGGRMLRALLSVHFGYSKATNIVVALSKGIGALLLVMAIGQFLLAGLINLSFIVAAIFLYAASRSEKNIVGFRQMKGLIRKKKLLAARGMMPTKQFAAFHYVRARDIVALFCPEQYCVVMVMDEGYHIKGKLTETELWEALPERGICAKLGDFL